LVKLGLAAASSRHLIIIVWTIAVHKDLLSKIF
jgi:hypothetical protein